jgi:CRP/FNR family transcriptional regulator, cyclic AMP receptor protein
MTTHEAGVLAAQQFLRGMRDDHLTRLAAMCSHVVVPTGLRLFDEGQNADRFWLIDAGQVTLDVTVPGCRRLIIDTLGRGDVLGVSWLLPPFQWRFGAVATQLTQAFQFDARAVRAACDDDPVLGYALCSRFSAVLVRRLQATRARLLDTGIQADVNA